MTFSRYVTHRLEERACLADFKSGLLSRFHGEHPLEVYVAAEKLLQYADSKPLPFALIEGPILGTPSDPKEHNSFQHKSNWKINFHSSYAVMPSVGDIRPLPFLFQVVRHVREWIGDPDKPKKEDFASHQDDTRFYYHEDLSYFTLDDKLMPKNRQSFPIGTDQPKEWEMMYSGTVVEELKSLMPKEKHKKGLTVAVREFIFLDKSPERDLDRLREMFSSEKIAVIQSIPVLQYSLIGRNQIQFDQIRSGSRLDYSK